ncbi:pyrokinin-1 receptor-like [Centruroides vittatus]|uniref:pyrokinin-1 receptor-like n=1 Tax=Centruroides vittatus TaxID=120091 RepID=UPI003510147C
MTEIFIMNPGIETRVEELSTVVLFLIENDTEENESSLDLGPKMEPLYIAIPMTFVYAIILITGMIGNVCTCVVITRNKYMHTATNYYLFNLAISDLLLLIMGLPQEMYQLWVRYPYVFGEFFCIFRGLTSETSTNASILTITSFTVERYLAICHPLRAQTMSKLSRAVKFIIVIWIMAALFATPLVVQFGIVVETSNDVAITDTTICTVKNPLKHAFESSTFLFFILPMTIISALYVLIGLKLRESSNLSRCVPTDSAPMTNGWRRNASPSIHVDRRHISKHGINRQTSSSRQAVIKMLVAVVVAFFICWAPFHAQRLMAVYAMEKTPTNIVIYSVLTYISGITYYVSSTINPILYSIMSLKFRHAFRDTLARCFGRKRNKGMRNLNSRYNSTIRSTDFTLVSDCLHTDKDIKTSRFLARTNTNPVFRIHDCKEDKITNISSVNNSNLHMMDDNVCDDNNELSESMAKLRSNRG